LQKFCAFGPSIGLCSRNDDIMLFGVCIVHWYPNTFM
jgi:hypothetical protein